MDTQGTTCTTLIPLPSLAAEGKVCEHHEMGLPFGSQYCLEENIRLFLQFKLHQHKQTDKRRNKVKMVISVLNLWCRFLIAKGEKK